MARLSAGTEKFFIPVATQDYRELLARDDVDIVSVCTPPSAHEQIVSDALHAGKFVICEKPLAASLAAVDRIQENFAAHLDRLSVVYQLRYTPEIQRMIWLRDHGHLGKLVYGHAHRLSGLQGTSLGWWGKWATAGGGVVMTQFIHHLDQLYHLFGSPTEVRATIDTTLQAIESEDCFGAEIKFQSGALVTCAATVAAHGTSYTLDIVGAEMSVHMPWQLKSANSRRLATAKRASDAALGGDLKKNKRRGQIGILLNRNRLLSLVGRRIRYFKPPPPGHAPYFAAVLDAIDAGQPLPLGIDEARVSLEMCQAIYESGLTGQAVKLPLDRSASVYEGITPEDYKLSREHQHQSVR